MIIVFYRRYHCLLVSFRYLSELLYLVVGFVKVCCLRCLGVLSGLFLCWLWCCFDSEVFSVRLWDCFRIKRVKVRAGFMCGARMLLVEF